MRASSTSPATITARSSDRWQRYMGAPEHPVWQALEPYRIGPPDAALTFITRLARENRWSEEFAARVIAEYKRFCFLAVTAGHEVTPSDAVDQAWHLHLTYSRDYWERFCPHVLGRDLHHGPTAGGGAEQARYSTSTRGRCAATKRRSARRRRTSGPRRRGGSGATRAACASVPAM